LSYSVFNKFNYSTNKDLSVIKIENSNVYTKKGKFKFGFKLTQLSDNELKSIDGGFLLKNYSFFFNGMLLSD